MGNESAATTADNRNGDNEGLPSTEEAPNNREGVAEPHAIIYPSAPPNGYGPPPNGYGPPANGYGPPPHQYGHHPPPPPHHWGPPHHQSGHHPPPPHCRGRGRGRGWGRGRGRGRGRGFEYGRGRGPGRGRGRGRERGRGRGGGGGARGGFGYWVASYADERGTSIKFDNLSDAFPPHESLSMNEICAVNHAIGAGSFDVAPQTGRVIFNEEMCRSAEIMNLFSQSDALSLCEDILEGENSALTNRAQIAVRFPEHSESVPSNREEYREDANSWHVDGFQLHRPLFIALAQTHHKVQRKMIAAEGYEGFWQQNHRPEYREEWDVQSVQCKVDIGDIVIAHPFLAHKGGLNYSPDNRYMCYFRVKSKGFQQMSQDDRIQNLWIGMNGMRDVLNGSNGGSADEEQ